MKTALAIGLMFALLTRLTVPALGQSDASSRGRARVVEIAPGTRVEVRLVSERRLKGLRGEVTEDGFLLMNGVKGNGGSERIAFADVRSIKVLKSHTTRNVLIVVGVGVVVVAVIFAVALGRAFTTYN